ncbi:MAG: glycoside hydrolase family 36 protein [Actinomycetota bacterium]
MDLEFLDADAPAGCVVETSTDDGVITWSVANEGPAPVVVDRVLLRWRTTGRTPTRWFRNGWQSWSPSGGGPIPAEAPLRARGSNRAGGALLSPDRADPSDPRSELVTLVGDPDGAFCLGFDGGDRHDGRFRVRGAEIVAEAYLGGAVLGPGESRTLHAIQIERGEPAELLQHWAAWAGQASRARRDASHRVGWCSWYQYFGDVTEDVLRANLADAGDWPIEVFQLDDGYQTQIGDWLRCSDAFSSSLERIAADVASAGFVPGLWLAPFLVSPRSRVAADHPDWIVRTPAGTPVVGLVNAAWGGEQHVLDTTHPDVLSHLEALTHTLVGMGWRYLKLDFTYAPALPGDARDPSRTPAERVRLGFDALRRGTGDEAFILGCGAPLGPCIGVVDGMRIGPDIAPYWTPRRSVGGGGDDAPAILNAWRNTLARSFMHRRLWLNDPDCLVLRRRGTRLTGRQRLAWTHAVAASGGIVVLSDDLHQLDPQAHDLLDEVLGISRAVDDASRSGVAPACPDLLERWTPTTLEAGFISLVGDPTRGVARLSTM